MAISPSVWLWLGRQTLTRTVVRARNCLPHWSHLILGSTHPLPITNLEVRVPMKIQRKMSRSHRSATQATGFREKISRLFCILTFRFGVSLKSWRRKLILNDTLSENFIPPVWILQVPELETCQLETSGSELFTFRILVALSNLLLFILF